MSYRFLRVRDTDLRELLRGSSDAFVFRVLGLGSAYLLSILITRNLGAEAMGLFAISFTVLQIASVIARLGTDTALLRFVAEYTAKGNKALAREAHAKALRIVFPFSLLVGAVLYFVSPYIAKVIFHKEHLSFYFRLVSIVVPAMALLAANSESLRGLKRLREYLFLQILAVPLVAVFALTLMLLFFRRDYTPVVAYGIAVVVVAVFSFLVWQRNSGRNNSGYREEGINYRAILNVSVPMLLASSLALIMYWTDTLMLGMLSSEADVGIYTVALRVAGVIGISLFAINSVAAPKFAELYGRGDMEGLSRVASQSTKLIFWSSSPILLALFFFPAFFLGLFGNEFETGKYALLFLALGQFVNAISGSVEYILQMTGRQKTFQNIILTSTALNIVLNAVLIPRYGITGAALASMVSMVFWNISAVILIKKDLGVFTLYMPLLVRKL